ncbi:MAG: C10 family peptidase [Muribaculaceae bacterium]|nr:C10 family peptidase [Muribaculaceae bacterium]
MKTKFFIFGAALFGLYSCSSEEAVLSPDADMTQDEIASTGLCFTVIDTTRVVSTEAKAMDIATRFLGGSEIKTRTTGEGNVTTIYQENGVPAMYVVNYGEDGGFVIVSATKDTEPILAFSDSGSFVIDNIENSPAGLWLDDTKQYVEHSSSLPDSVKLGYAQQWATLTNNTVPATKALTRGWTDPEEVVCVNQALEYYYNQGYEIIENPSSDVHSYSYTLNQALDNLSDQKDYDGFSQREKSFLMIKSKNQLDTVKPKTTTLWHQNSPYNGKIIEKYPNVQSIGCVPVAVAQLMKYYARPGGGFQYDKMPNVLHKSNVEEYEILSGFMLYIGERLGIEYNKGKSNSSYKKATDLLKTHGFPHIRYIDYDFYTVKPHIQKGPIGLRAKDQNAVGHVWVCDGYYLSSTDTEYMVLYYNGNYMDATPAACLTPIYTEVNTTGNRYMHMNWGWEDNRNGYFNDNWVVKTYAYLEQRKAIIDFY